MNQLKEQIEREAERLYPYRSWHTAHNFRTDLDRKKFIKGANFALGLDRWVKVEDGLPEERVLSGSAYSNDVLVTDGMNISMAHFNIDAKIWVVYKDPEPIPVVKITHWQPLPNLPK